MTVHRRTPPWLFALTGLPYGVPSAFTGVVTPYLERRAGVEVEKIAWFVTLLFVPSFCQFLYAPVVDYGMQRKHWLVTMSVLAAACLFIACQMHIPEDTNVFLAFAFLAQVFSGLIGSCNGGLMATCMTDAQRGKAGGWYNVGNVAGGGLAGAAAVYMTGHGSSTTAVGGTLAAMMIVPSLAVLWIDEPLRERTGTLLAALRNLLVEVKDVMWTRAGLTGLLLCLSPVGTAALANVFSGIAQDYVQHDLAAELAKLPADQAASLLDTKVSELTSLVQGPIGQGFFALGALGGGLLCDRTNRRAIYLLSGVLSAIVGFAMALSPTTRTTFAVGGLAYQLVTGICYASFTAVVLETIGKDDRSAATRYSMFTAAGNVAISYVGNVDAHFMTKHGVAGVVASDATLNIAGVVVLGLVFWRLGSFGKSRHVEPPPASPPPPAPELPVAKIVE
ncbi:MAG TPA: MFS transporter [Kofleriaceae bacterium]|nr:MFS transporter [Kofleriaceae bacterium]